jgi:hypothetical protein
MRPQTASRGLDGFLAERGIARDHSPAHVQQNGQAERRNQTVMGAVYVPCCLIPACRIRLVECAAVQKDPQQSLACTLAARSPRGTHRRQA